MSVGWVLRLGGLITFPDLEGSGGHAGVLTTSRSSSSREVPQGGVRVPSPPSPNSSSSRPSRGPGRPRVWVRYRFLTLDASWSRTRARSLTAPTVPCPQQQQQQPVQDNDVPFEGERELLPAPKAGMPSRHAGAKAEDTTPMEAYIVVIFDWDDTLCPTLWLGAQGLIKGSVSRWRPPTLEEKGRVFQVEMASLILLERTLAVAEEVTIVTNAMNRMPFFSETSRRFLPAVARIIRERKIYVVSV
uniref:Uncharacterized protein n=1 Tax=Chromera velia CCMP2878 TaxID=1169474 RepID=A0A0G4HBW8_9ALVE|eukprot:Cvel_910.t1-p1 / transcript=Cvel_910.t1 / gene=Cvel_910 / organism=Chromera_velia_CCMP2878 / gene_product=hypothetical protein / transcript_product=hypothetical protein / location=Cvel_scaffold29:238-1382(-) / protein_length=244 / sequence_SO=supercontig / SO=protein_coding / is_pseudo=false